MAHQGLRLIVVTTERGADGKPIKDGKDRQLGHVDLIHETLIRARARTTKASRSATGQRSSITSPPIPTVAISYAA
jgi:hypothetical protein